VPGRGYRPLTGVAGQAVIGFQDAARGHAPRDKVRRELIDVLHPRG
jgi:hypothetical protein